jgi:hypothetical protein
MWLVAGVGLLFPPGQILKAKTSGVLHRFESKV